MRSKGNRRGCEECGDPDGPLSNLRERIWEKQLLEKREIILNTNVTDAVVEMIVVQIQNFNDYDDACDGMKGFEREPIKIFINTNGGEIYAALAVCSAIEASVTPVFTIALGKAFSAGFLILIAGHLRFAQKHASIMHHTGSGGAVGVITDIIEEAEELEKLNEKIHQLITYHTGITDEQLDEVFYRKNNWYMNTEEALALGVIDGIHGYELPEEDECGEEDEPAQYENECDACYDKDCADCTLEDSGNK